VLEQDVDEEEEEETMANSGNRMRLDSRKEQAERIPARVVEKSKPRFFFFF
jgi:hypothetical protein